MSHKIRVLFVGAFLNASQTKVRGGVQFECQSLIESPVSQHVAWYLLDTTMESLPPPPFVRRLQLAMLRFVRFIWQLLFNRPDCCLIYASSGASFVEKGTMTLLARMLRVRVILRPVSGLIIDDYRRNMAFQHFIRLVLQSASVVACQGTRWREFFRATGNLSAEATPLIYNPVDASKYAHIPCSGDRPATKALLIGWVDRNKGIWDLLEVVRRFRQDLAGMQFVICGKGGEFEQFAAAITQEGLDGFFDLRGWVNMDEKLAAFGEAEIFLMLSHREGLPNALLEAMAAGRAVIATAVGAVPDMIRQGDTGMLCEPRDVEDIGRSILQLRGDAALRQRLAQAARERIVGEVDYQIVWQQWARILLDGSVAGQAEGDT